MPCGIGSCPVLAEIRRESLADGIEPVTGACAYRTPVEAEAAYAHDRDVGPVAS